MQLPPRITPSFLRADLASAGYCLTVRTLKLRRDREALPKLQTRGCGYGRGKLQFWRSPGLFEHAVADCILRRLRYPNDEARLVLWWSGFPISPAAVRSAWLSRLGKMKSRLESQKESAITHAASRFFDVEDELSERVKPYLRMLMKQFHVPESVISQAVMDLFGFVFQRGYLPDVNLLADLAEIILAVSKDKIAEIEWISEADFAAISRFFKDNMSFHAVRQIATSASDIELIHAHRRWRSILAIAERNVPELTGEREIAVLVAAGFGRICLPTIIRWIRNGKSKQMDQSLVEVRKFCNNHDLRKIITGMSFHEEIVPTEKLALFDLVRRLAEIWSYSGFPFSVSLA
jgi:hypothetical protein